MGIQVNQQNPLTLLSGKAAQGNAGGGFTYPTLLVCNSQDAQSK
jgi:hypothetical protein